MPDATPPAEPLLPPDDPHRMDPDPLPGQTLDERAVPTTPDLGYPGVVDDPWTSAPRVRS